MKKVRWICLALSAIIITLSARIEAATVFAGEENSLTLYNYLSDELLKDSADQNSSVYVKKLVMLSDAAGYERTAKLFKEAAEKIVKSGNTGSASYMLMKLFLEEFQNGTEPAGDSYRGIDKWSLSGPWQRYGAPDIDYSFPPEAKTGVVEKNLRKIAAQNWKVYPFGFIPERRGIIYAKTSFSSSIPVRLWIVSNAGYKLFVNGRETLHCGRSERRSISGISMKGTDGFTLLLKIADNKTGEDPYFRVVITDLNNRPIQKDFSNIDYTGNYFAEKEYVSEDISFTPAFEGGIQGAKLRRLIAIGDLVNASTLGLKIVKEYPFYADAYFELFPLLDRLKRNNEFRECINSYKKNFPESDYSAKWEADFYRTRDAARFAEVSVKLHSSLVNNETAAAYMKYLGDGDCKEALKFSEKFRYIPSLRSAVSETIRKCSGNEEWRKYLIGMIASTGDPFFYYQMGIADMNAGLDPVLYWEKGLSINSSMRDMRDMSDIYENGAAKGNSFYIGKYTDFHPEFEWDGIKRSVAISAFENGSFMTECEDIIPGELSDDESFRIVKLRGLKILYVLKGKEGTVESAEYELLTDNTGDTFVKIKDKSECDFLIIKYSGYSAYEKYPFYIARDFLLRTENEKISELKLEVLSYCTLKPAVSFKDRTLNAEGDDSAALKFTAEEYFTSGDKGKSAVTINMFSSDREFASWYGDLLELRKTPADIHTFPDLKGETLQKTVENVKKYISENFKNDGTPDFEPEKPGIVFAEKHGTAEELAILSAVIFESAGIKTFPAFIRGKNKNYGDNANIALYIPFTQGKGYWLNFNSGLTDFKNTEALIIKGESFEIMPVVQEGGE